METATLRYDALSHITWLEFDGKPDEMTRAALKSKGWRWSGYRKQWYNNRRGADALVPESIEVEQDDGECDYSAERAERLDARAGRHAEASHAAHERVHSIVEHIPFGQPILVGHHSERHARADIARIDAGMRRAVGESDTAKHLSERAESSRRHQAHVQSAGAIARRIQVLEAEHRSLQRLVSNTPKDAPYYWVYAGRVDEKHAEIERERAALEAAGGIAADTLQPQAGDIVRIKGSIARVDRVNAKTLRCTIVEGGAKGWPMNYDKSWLQEIVKRKCEI